MNERDKKKWYDIELRKVQALEDLAETLEGLLLHFHKK